jgi:hypothetical protein
MVPPRVLTAADLLAPVTATLRGMSSVVTPSRLVADLVVSETAGWLPATRLIDGSHLPRLLDAAQRQWQASPHAAAALVWKSYSYWMALPAVLGWASCRRVPLLHPADVLLDLRAHRAIPTIGLHRSVTVAVLPSAPLAPSEPSQVRLVEGEAELLALLRESLLDAHLMPLLEAFQGEVRVGTRTLLGSVSSGIATGILRAAHLLPGTPADHIATLLDALGVADLIELVSERNGRPVVRRRTCCLAFTLPRPKICAGCCIRL